MLQVAPGFSVPEHAGTSVGALNAKSAASAPALSPLTVNVGPASATCPVFVTRTVNRPLEFPTSTVPRFNCAGETPIIGGVNPVPPRLAVTAATPTVLVPTVSVAVTAPATTGVNVTATVQVAADARVAPHVVAPVEKPAAPGPVIENTGCAIGLRPSS